jgi:site-specific recombinase XerD
MNSHSFNNLLNQFQQDLQYLKNFKDDTVKTYLSCIKDYERFCREMLKINLLQSRQEDLLEFILHLKENLSVSRLTQYRASLRRFFNMLFLYNEIKYNPADHLPPLKRRRSNRYQHISADVIFRILKTMQEHPQRAGSKILIRDKLMLLMLWCLGLRSGELRTIRKQDVRIINADKKTALLTVHGKGAKQRALLVVDNLYDLLNAYIKEISKQALIFPGKDGRVLDDSAVNKRLEKYTLPAGIDLHITAHCLRHAFATEMYYADVPLEAIRIMMGHENLRETALYIHVSRNDMQASLNLLTLRV